MPAQVPTMDEFNALDARVKALETHPPVGGPTPDGTYITKVTDPAIVDDVGNHYTLVQGSAAQALQIAKNGVTDTVTQHVVTLGIEKRKAIQKNSEGNWYQDNNNTSKTNVCSWQQTSDPHAPPIPAGSMFKVANGQFHRPDGSVFKPTGTNVWWMSISHNPAGGGWGQGDQVVSDWNSGYPILTCFPGLNMVRLLCFMADWPTDEQLKPWIDFFTSKKIIVLIDPHDYSGGSNWVYSYADGSLQSAIDFLKRVANTNKNNPYVWYQTENEPGTPNRDEILGLYHAVRDVGNPHPILIGWVTWGYDYRVDRDVTSGMTNVGIDVHFYAGDVNDSVQGFKNRIHDMFNSVRSNLAQSADGEIPIGIYEFGDACCGHVDNSGQVACQAVCESGDVRGWASFNYTTDGNYNWGHDILNQRQNPVLAGVVVKPYMTGP